jgi:hypothetical protein
MASKLRQSIKRVLNRTFNVRVANKVPLKVRVANKEPLTVRVEAGSLKTPSTDNVLELILAELKTHRRELEALRIAVTAETLRDVSAFFERQVSSLRETLEMLATTDISMARFGDGEFRLMLRDDFNLRFQPNSSALQQDLEAVLRLEDPSVLVCFPQVFRDAHWSGVYQELWPTLQNLIHGNQRFGCAHVTRPQVFADLGSHAVQLWRQVWDRKNVVVVTGEGSRFELVPDLFDNVTSSQFVRGPAIGAYAQLQALEAEALQAGADVALLALGPAGTVLAPRLARQGLRALDIGHLSNSYLSAVGQGPRPEALPIARGGSA